MLKTAGMVTAVILLLLLKPAAGATAVQEVTVTVPESVEIMVLWQEGKPETPSHSQPQWNPEKNTTGQEDPRDSR